METVRLVDVNAHNVVTVDGEPYEDYIVELYENYDRGFADWCNFSYQKHEDGTMLRVPTVFATPDRAFGQYGRTLEEKYKKRFNKESLPLPFISMSRLGVVDDPSRREYAKIRKRMLSKDRRKWVGGNYPIPVNLGYEINIWSKTLRTADAIRLQLKRSFYRSQLVVLDIYHPLPLSWQKVIMRYTGFTDNTNLEPGTTEERMVRHTHSFEIEGWITYPYEITPSVISVHQNIEVESNVGDSVVLDRDLVYVATPEDLLRNLEYDIRFGLPLSGTLG